MSEYFDRIICADAIDGLKTLDDESVDMCVTSPPYYGLRDYGIEGQIGVEKSPDKYIDKLTNVFTEIKRVLRSDGTLWLNIADSYAGSGKGANAESNAKNEKSRYLLSGTSPAKLQPKSWGNIKPKDMIGIPWMLAFSLRESGWYLRSDIIWHKTNCLPESVKDRPSKSYEHIFLLSKSPKYYFDYMAIREPLKEVSKERYKRGRSGKTKYVGTKFQHQLDLPQDNSLYLDQEYRRKRDVWELSTNTYKSGEHFAMYPEKLIEPCILAGSRIGDVVLDPFLGSGTTGVVAKRLGRKYIGIDLNPRFCELAKQRIEMVKTEL